MMRVLGIGRSDMNSCSADRRLRELERFLIVGSRREPEFDGLADLARKVTGLPMAAIGFLSEAGVWLKAVSGALAGDDAQAGPASAVRLMADAMARGAMVDVVAPEDAPGIGYFAAEPLSVRPGLTIGVLAVFSDAPGQLAPDQRDGLAQVARAVVDRLRLDRIRFERTRERAMKRARNAEIAAQKSEIVRQRVLLEQTSRMARVGGWEYDVTSDAMTWSPEVYRIVELPAAVRPSLGAMRNLVIESDRERISELFRRALADGHGFECETTIRTSLGRWRLVRCLCEPQVGKTGEVEGLVGTLQDVSDRRAIEDRIVYLARHDTMTGLANRAVFRERLEACLQGLEGLARTVGLCMVDVDHFKTINDTLGHQAGDELLIEIGRRFSAVIGDSGTVARIGGDEFAIILDRVAGAADVAAVGEALMRAAAEPVVYGDESIPVSLSVGVAVGSIGDSAEELLKNADIALYEAKGRGRNRSVVFDRTMRDELEIRQTILRDIRIAIERGELMPYFQPQVHLRDGRHAGFEALLRWRRRDGLVATPAFFGIAFDDPQLGRAIGETVIEQSAAQAGAWQRMGLAFDHVAINISSAQVRPGDLAEQILSALERHAVPAERFMVEVTETVLLSREAGVVGAALKQLKAAGVRIALDDFGTGYASLTHLKDFPVDLLKIDRSFVASLGDTRESRAIVRGIAGIARDLGIAVIAEGIETEAQAEILARFGIALGQGFLYARPMDPGAATRHLLEGAAQRAAIPASLDATVGRLAAPGRRA
jgi:diguanylate cyclase (GGDEF)-like protein